MNGLKEPREVKPHFNHLEHFEMRNFVAFLNYEIPSAENKKYLVSFRYLLE